MTEKQKPRHMPGRKLATVLLDLALPSTLTLPEVRSRLDKTHPELSGTIDDKALFYGWGKYVARRANLQDARADKQRTLPLTPPHPAEVEAALLRPKTPRNGTPFVQWGMGGVTIANKRGDTLDLEHDEFERLLRLFKVVQS
jgi:hypothetical protein